MQNLAVEICGSINSGMLLIGAAVRDAPADFIGRAPFCVRPKNFAIWNDDEIPTSNRNGPAAPHSKSASPLPAESHAPCR